MADISPYLTAIMEAVYGEEVRSSIHDAIEAINAESSEAKSAAITAQNSATASATSASNSASSAEGSSTSAASSASLAREAKDDANSAAQAAIAAKGNAQYAATQAGNSASDAAYAASSALSSLSTIDDKVANVETMESNLARFHSVFIDLEDSTGEDILDSSGNKIIGRVIYADAADIVKLQNSIKDIIENLNILNSLLLCNRIEAIEKKLSEKVEVDITHLQEHSLLDDTY